MAHKVQEYSFQVLHCRLPPAASSVLSQPIVTGCGDSVAVLCVGRQRSTMLNWCFMGGTDTVLSTSDVTIRPLLLLYAACSGSQTDYRLAAAASFPSVTQGARNRN